MLWFSRRRLVGSTVLFLDRREPAEILPECAANHGVVVLVVAGEVHVLPAGGVRLQPVEHLPAQTMNAASLASCFQLHSIPIRNGGSGGNLAACAVTTRDG